MKVFRGIHAQSEEKEVMIGHVTLDLSEAIDYATAISPLVNIDFEAFVFVADVDFGQLQPDKDEMTEGVCDHQEICHCAELGHEKADHDWFILLEAVNAEKFTIAEARLLLNEITQNDERTE